MGFQVTARSPFTIQIMTGLSQKLQLGMVLEPDEEIPHALIVSDLREPSSISEWNRLNHEAVRVQLGDVITSVNGVSSNSAAMLEHFISASQSHETVDLTFHVWPRSHFEDTQTVAGLVFDEHEGVREAQISAPRAPNPRTSQ